MNFIIKEADLNDYEAITKLHDQLHELHVGNRPDLYQSSHINLDFEYFKEIIESENSKIYIVNDEDERILAYTILKIEETPIRSILVERKIIYINDFCVDEQSRRNGVGQFLFEEVKLFAKEIGATSVELVVHYFNESAIEFYHSMGMNTKTLRMELTL